MPVATKKPVATNKPAPTKAVSATAAATAAATPVAAATASATPVAAKAPAAKKATPAKTVEASVPQVPASASSASATTTVVEDKTADKGCEVLLASLVEKVNAMGALQKEIQNMIKMIGKEYDKQQKVLDKVQKKRQNAKNSPSGFAKPNKISNELCDFIGVPHGTEKSRTDITRFINAYVKEHNLNKPDNRRFIIPDAKLKAILNVKDGEEINYFILQKLISHHFPPSASKQAKA